MEPKAGAQRALSKTVVPMRVSWPALENDAMVAGGFYAFETSDGSSYAGRIPVNYFRFFGHMLKLEVTAVIKKSATPAYAPPSKNYTIKSVNSVSLRGGLTCATVRSLLVVDVSAARILDEPLGTSRYASEQRAAYLRLSQDNAWLDYFETTKTLGALFYDVDAEVRGCIDVGMSWRELFTLFRDIMVQAPLDPATLANHPALRPLVTMLPLFKGAPHVAAAVVLEAAYGKDRVASFPPATALGLQGLVLNKPLSLFFHATAPLALGPIPVHLFPRVAEAALHDTLAPNALDQVRAYTALIDQLRRGPSGGYVCLEADSAEVAAGSYGVTLLSLEQMGVVVRRSETVERRSDSLMFASTADYVYERRVHDAQRSFVFMVLNMLRTPFQGCTDLTSEELLPMLSGTSFVARGNWGGTWAVMSVITSSVTAVDRPEGPERTTIAATAAAFACVCNGWNVVLLSRDDESVFNLTTSLVVEGSALESEGDEPSETWRARIATHTFDMALLNCRPPQNQASTCVVVDYAEGVRLVEIAHVLALHPTTRMLVLTGDLGAADGLGLASPFPPLCTFLTGTTQEPATTRAFPNNNFLLQHLESAASSLRVHVPPPTLAPGPASAPAPAANPPSV